MNLHRQKQIWLLTIFGPDSHIHLPNRRGCISSLIVRLWSVLQLPQSSKAAPVCQLMFLIYDNQDIFKPQFYMKAVIPTLHFYCFLSLLCFILFIWLFYIKYATQCQKKSLNLWCHVCMQWNGKYIHFTLIIKYSCCFRIFIKNNDFEILGRAGSFTKTLLIILYK